MKIINNAVYHLPTQAHEDSFLKQAEEQNIRWSSFARATTSRHWNCTENYYIYHTDNELTFSDTPDNRVIPLPVIEWHIPFTKADMKPGMLFKVRDGSLFEWCDWDANDYNDDLTDRIGVFDIVAVYEPTAIWTRPEPRYRVKGELTKEQAERLGIELCEEVEG